MSGFRPLLGAKIDDLDHLFKLHRNVPFFASYKLDGIRAVKYGPELVSRSLKTIPNRAIRSLLGDVPSGWDGELIVAEPNAPDVYRRTDSQVMRLNGVATQTRFFVFDNCEAVGDFEARLATLHDLPPHTVKHDQHLCSSPEEVLALESTALKLGYEGLVLRHPGGRYKSGRSTLREGYLLKLKRFTDEEATVIGFQELLHNANEADTDERGYTKRSSHQANKVPMGTLGALLCRTKDGVDFAVGTGFDASERLAIWRARESFQGKLIKFKSFRVGVKTAPRHPVFIGWRSEIDQ